MKISTISSRHYYLKEALKILYSNATGWLLCHRGLILSVVACMLSYGSISAQQKSSVVRLAKLQIDSSRLESYKVALKEEIETSIRVEPGVLTLYAVAEKGNPWRIIIFEIYANEDAYHAHLETPHFKKYKSTTKEMVKSLELVEVDPIVLGTKAK